MHRLLLIAAGLAALFAMACTSKAESRAKAPSEERRATLLFTGDLWGQLEPCGCSADMRGGLDRAASYVKKIRAEGPSLLVDAGDALFDAVEYGPERAPQARRQAKAVADSLLAMGLSAKAAFERDRVAPELLKDLPAGLILQGPGRREVGGIQIALVPFDALDAKGKDADNSLRDAVAAARVEGVDVVVALLHAPRDRAIQLGSQSGADLVVASHIRDIAEGESARAVIADTPIFFTQARGQSLLEVEMMLRPGGGKLQIAGSAESRDAEIESIGERVRSYEQRIAALGESADAAPFRAKVEELEARRRALSDEAIPTPARGSFLAYRFVPITSDLPPDPEVAAIISRYDREVGAANLALAKAQNKVCEDPAAGSPGYAGTASCATCHAAAHDFWTQTAHGDAYATLEEANKQYDLNCISCHVTGWEKPGGACRVDEVEARKDVGCESCHGPGSLHVANPTGVKLARQVAEPTCRGCHSAEHSTDFDYSAYLSRILGPGHGAPVTSDTR